MKEKMTTVLYTVHWINYQKLFFFSLSSAINMHVTERITEILASGPYDTVE